MGDLYTIDFKKGRAVSVQKAPQSTQSKEKQEFFTKLINAGLTLTKFDPNSPGVQIPAFLKKEEAVALKWSHKFGISDFSYDSNGISATLSFNREPFYCVVPWEAISDIWLDSDKNFGKTWENNPDGESGTEPELEKDTSPGIKRAVFKGFRQLLGLGEKE